MNIQFFTTRFSANAEAVERLLKNIDEAHSKWKPGTGSLPNGSRSRPKCVR